MRTKTLTLCLVHKGDRLLLGMKKRGFGAGRWNGFGGKVEPGETVEEAAVRELHEEAGIAVKRRQDIERAGRLFFSFLGDPVGLAVEVFRVRGFSGLPRETEEMYPQWFHRRDIPFHRMWPDDKHWLPLFLDGDRFIAEFEFADHDTIVGHAILHFDRMKALRHEPEGWRGRFVSSLGAHQLAGSIAREPMSHQASSPAGT